jgi:hypothetical protein
VSESDILKPISSRLFSWKQRPAAADRIWQRIYDLMGSKNGVTWVAKRIVGTFSNFLFTPFFLNFLTNSVHAFFHFGAFF